MQAWPTARHAIRVGIVNARLLLLIAVVLCHCHALAAKPAAKPAPEVWVERKLDRIIIPRIQLRDASLVEAVEFLRKEARRLDPRGTGLPITLQLETSAPVESSAAPVMQGLPPEPNPTPPGEAKMTVSLSNIPLREALHYVTGLANMKFWVRPDGVHIVPVLEPEPMFTREFAIPGDLFPAMEKEDRIAHTEMAIQTRDNFQEYLISNGVQFRTGATATLSPDAKRLTVHNTNDQFGLIKDILKSERPKSLLAVPGPEVPKFFPQTEASDAAAKRKRMERIILSDVAIKDKILSEAIHYLRNLGIRYDVREPLRNKRGVTIIVSDDETPHDALDAGNGVPPLISYSAKKVSLYDAVQAVAKLGGREIEFRRYGVALRTKISPEKLEIREYLVPPDFVDHQFQGPPAPVNEPDPKVWKDWLSSGGADFPAYPSAEYHAHSRRLLVRNTAEKLQRTQEYVEALWREYYAAHPPKKKSRR